jgi:hypothetical protein
LPERGRVDHPLRVHGRGGPGPEEFGEVKGAGQASEGEF